MPALPPRLARLPRAACGWPPAGEDLAPRAARERAATDLDVRLAPSRLDIRVAVSRRARLLGLAFLTDLPSGAALLLPRTRAVHTFGMRFALDLIWLDGAGRVVRVDRAVAPRQFAACRRAEAVIEVRA